MRKFFISLLGIAVTLAIIIYSIPRIGAAAERALAGILRAGQSAPVAVQQPVPQQPPTLQQAQQVFDRTHGPAVEVRQAEQRAHDQDYREQRDGIQQFHDQQVHPGR